MNNQYLNQLNSIQKQSLFQLYSSIFVSFFCLLSVIPGYKLIKIKQQKFLKLFATFDRQNLQEILSGLTYQLSFCKGFDDKNRLLESKSSLQSYVNQKDLNQQAFIVPVNIEKKLNISRTSTLNYSLKYLILGLICIFCLISIYPLISYVLIDNFIENSQLIFDFNSKNNYFISNIQYLFQNHQKDVVCQSYFFILNSIRARQGLAEAFLLPSKQSISVNALQDILSQMVQQADQLPSLIQENIGKVDSINLYNKDIFKNYLIKVYTENACDTIQNYSQYQNGDFLYDQCSTVGKGNLLRGLLYGVVYFISVFNEFLNFAFSDNVEEFQQKFNQYNLNTSAYKQFQFRIELSKAHEYLMNFFQDQNLQLYNFYENVAIILVVVQMLFVVLVFLVCWYFYIKKLNQLITSTRQLLDVFPHKIILKNTYIMSYLRQNE
ncbi:transmembrane protein, putative (macronuclear) [Tetrahymena thermophila SB210]|uniref:Transmembrane protein, putative n=1 Tax=Tetrahymena thermophila (strain SB210) TaxID=312017 RepID=W7X552_TETTS|nr:transmembrane protein, putative [Tetrahymena thermophila SB210]EWS72527.1 transmembrane protein, putative [Tetrahymena thermophila SB210]|eukprot:XP_012654929.1 transmembrane protein, putative [Tetrahymena thermophila SB210]